MSVDDLRNEILIRHLAGIASPRSEATLRRWIDEDPEFADHVARVRAAWDDAGVAPDRHDPDAALARVIERIERQIETAPRAVRPITRAPESATGLRARPVRTRPGPGLRWAAVIVLAAGVAFWGRQVFRSPALQSHVTAAGERATLRLDDRSQVMLAPDSELQFPARFRGRSREVRLRGSAYFSVSSDQSRPFIVHAGGTTTRVLGTRFLVRAYRDDAGVAVAVTEGRVAIQRNTAPDTEAAIVSQGQLARLSEQGATEVVDHADIDELMSWTEGRIVFRDRALAEVLRELERWYGETMRVAEPALGERRVTLSFQDATLEEILEVLAVSLGLRIEREDGRVSLYDAHGRP